MENRYNSMQTPDKELYLAENGWHFNKKACDYAGKLLRKKNTMTGKTEPIEAMSKEQVDELLTRYGIKLEKSKGLDYVYVANMGKSDVYKSSVPDDSHLALYIKDMIDDSDAADGEVMTCWYAKMIRRRQPVDWGSFL